MIRLLLLLAFLISITVANCQLLYNDPQRILEKEMIENQISKAENAYDFSDVIDEIHLPKPYVININKADEEDLKKLHLNDLQIQNLFGYIKEFGELTSIFEMNLIEGFDSTLLEQIKPNIIFSLNKELYPFDLKSITKTAKHTFLIKEQRVLEHQKGYGYSDNKESGFSSSDSLTHCKAYIGSPDKILFKYAYNYHDRLRFGVTLEKDAGEALRNGFDYAGIHFYYKGLGFIKSLVVGDYNLHFGHGLTMGTGFNLMANPLSGSWVNAANRITASTAANEGASLRGAAVTLSPGQHSNLTFFYSFRKIDASLSDPNDTLVSSEGNYYDGYLAKSIIETGLHRTDLELARKGRLRQSVIGGNFNTRYRFLRFGATATYTKFNPGLSEKDKPEQQFNFYGTSLIDFGTDFTVTWKSLVLFSEISGSDNGSKAFIGGLRSEEAGDHGFTIFYRSYDKEYHNFFSSAWSQNPECRNERGYYSALWIKPIAGWIISAGADIYRFPWIKYRTNAPSTGKDYFIRSEVGFNQQILLTAKYTLKESSYNKSDQLSQLDYPVPGIKHNLRFELSYSPSVSLKFKDRLDLTFNEASTAITNGFMIYHDMVYHKEGSPVQFYFRYLLFDTDTYNDRIYTYENDLLYSWSVPSFSGKGSRFYSMVKFDVGIHTSLWLKYSLTSYSGRNTIGTGNEESNGNKRSEIKMQVVVKI